MAYINGKEILFSSTFSETNTELLENFARMVEGEQEELILPDGIKSIREYAFYRHPMTRIEIPSSVERIYRSAFHTCSSCMEYDFTKHETVPTLENVNVFSGIAGSAKIKVPSDLYSRWITATNWSEYASYIEAAIDGIVTPSEDVFEATVSVNTAQGVTMGFLFSDNLRRGTRYVARDWQGYDSIETTVYELESASAVLTMDGMWQGDNYSTGGYDVSGLVYTGTITFKEVGTYRIYQKYYDAAGNEHTTGSYVFEVK